MFLKFFVVHNVKLPVSEVHILHWRSRAACNGTSLAAVQVKSSSLALAFRCLITPPLPQDCKRGLSAIHAPTAGGAVQSEPGHEMQLSQCLQQSFRARWMDRMGVGINTHNGDQSQAPVACVFP